MLSNIIKHKMNNNDLKPQILKAFKKVYDIDDEAEKVVLRLSDLMTS